VSGRTWLGAAALAVAVALSSVAALYHVATIRMRKISLRRWLQR
jgi:ubiquinone biosynthesis protein